jgi:hypothetical protein
VVRGRVVFVVLRSGDDDHGTDEPGSALPLARFLPGYSRDLTGLDDQGAVETGGGRINPLPPRTFPFGSFATKSSSYSSSIWSPVIGVASILRIGVQIDFCPQNTDFVPKGL